MRAKGRGALLLLGCALGAADASAQQGESAADAGRHFRHGVELYGEANYSAALVEFKRAFALAPSSAALYDVGEAEFQLQHYAEALKTFRGFLAKYGPNETHRADVESNVQVLISRVGLVRVTSVPAGADIAVDDEAVGKTPLSEPLLVSVGHRKVAASIPGRPPAIQYIDVAAGDDVAVSLLLAPPPEAVVVAPHPDGLGPPHPPVVAHPTNTATWRTIGWIATSSLAAGALTFGALAVAQANALAEARGALTTSAMLDHHANLAKTFSGLADSMAACALLTGGVTLYVTLQSSSEGPRRATARAGRITIGPASAFFETTF